MLHAINRYHGVRVPLSSRLHVNQWMQSWYANNIYGVAAACRRAYMHQTQKMREKSACHRFWTFIHFTGRRQRRWQWRRYRGEPMEWNGSIDGGAMHTINNLHKSDHWGSLVVEGASLSITINGNYACLSAFQKLSAFASAQQKKRARSMDTQINQCGRRCCCCDRLLMDVNDLKWAGTWKQLGSARELTSTWPWEIRIQVRLSFAASDIVKSIHSRLFWDTLLRETFLKETPEQDSRYFKELSLKSRPRKFQT